MWRYKKTFCQNTNNEVNSELQSETYNNEVAKSVPLTQNLNDGSDVNTLIETNTAEQIDNNYTNPNEMDEEENSNVSGN